MRILTFNVLVGGEERFDAIRSIVAAERPDLLVLQECVGWEDGERLRGLAAAVGIPDGDGHLVVGTANRRPSGRRYNVCLASRAPILRRAVHAPPSMAHCVVEVELESGGGGEPLLVLGTHLVAGDEDARLAEVDELLRLVPPGLLAVRDCLLVGDLNGLSRRDPYPADLADRLARAGIGKYGRPPRFEVVDRLEKAGWVDALRARPRSSRWATAPRGGAGVVVDTRSDYIMLSQPLAARLEWADVVETGTASDHHAVVALLDGRDGY
ncbi:endonuclease/exonuclease/phosphatase family protein [Planomonospora sp. ID82291]|uniref:endonuclease/exonuclease/phosphatase family protein n=1 Tax=Planomonospora sp. ID82291 TaxID=2738136 RepID=UPI0018C3CBD0|nr:endonuclease/exonuclease/phosphatase family protein [Planomonospora sp. ID82291]MBG0818867.1 endonuclease/exonuclease/phosphatase family protein [Planomonospora sp. ID82291]